MNRKTSLGMAVAIALSAGSVPAFSLESLQVVRLDPESLGIPAAAPKAQHSGIYLVQLAGEPVLTYEGGIKGLPGTKPAKGGKLNPNSAHVKKYAAHLEAEQDTIMASVGAEKVYSYRYAANGFAARMSPAEAAALRQRGDVVNVWEDEILQPLTDASPSYVGITAAGEAWSKGYAGEDIVVGVIDTGIWPEHPSFADVPTHKKGNKGAIKPYGPPPAYFTSTACDFGNTAANPEDVAFQCNNKLLAARCYNVGQSFDTGPSYLCGGDGAAQGGIGYQSGRDDDGHGSHVASTAAGNYGVQAVIDGEAQGIISGMAPRARISSYKVCWPNEGGCASSDSAAAIDQAVLDGVDVINFSVGGASNFFAGFDDIAFLFAADAGVFVATSNGNAGPGEATVGTPAGVPWITAVGATHDLSVFYNLVTASAPAEVAGDYVAVEGNGDVALADVGAIAGDVTLVSDLLACGPIDPISGIALAMRGACAFTDKYNNAQAAGASAIIVFNDGATEDRFDPIAMSAPGTAIPGVMINYADGVALATASGVEGLLDPDNVVSAVNRVAEFSSRGQNNGAPDIIKPDVSAPGVNTVAAGTGGTDAFISLNGTSMASPHVAGAFALLKQAHPEWTPAQAKSALMTTARNGLLTTFGEDLADPFDVGAGEILPTDAFDPGLTYDTGFFDYLAMLCGEPAQSWIHGAVDCGDLEGAGFSTDPSDLNLASIGIGDLVYTQTVTRTVTASYNNSGRKTFTVSVDAPAGVDVAVSPATIKLKNGQSASYEVTFTVNDSAVMEEWTFGSLTWSDTGGVYSVASPIAVRPTLLSTVAEVDGTASVGGGSVEVPVAFGYDGVYNASVSGLFPSFSATDNLTAADGLHVYCVDLPAMTHFRLATFDEDTSDPGHDDIDLRLFLATDCATFDIGQIGASGNATSNEVIDVPNAPAGGYVVVVDYYAASNGSDTDYTVWLQPVFGDEGNTQLDAPGGATAGATDSVTVEYMGLVPTRNLGVLHHADGVGEITRTLLDVDASP